MDSLRATLDLYSRVFSRGATLAAANWPVCGTVFLYAALLWAGARLAAPFGIVGGLLLSILWAACASSFLFLVETMIRTTRVSLVDFKRSFAAYLGDVLGVTFVLWLALAFAGPAVLALPQGTLLWFFANLLVFVFFNAVPELIYLGHLGSLDLLRQSYLFIADNWIEWFPVTLLFLGAYGVLLLLAASGAPFLLVHILTAALAYVAMLVRGLLFIELQGTSRRGRAFRFRAGSR